MKHLILAAASVLTAFALQGEVPTAIAIKDARVVSVSGADLSKATVVLRDGLIQDVGPNVAIPTDAWVIDGDGLTVYPGFIDGLAPGEYRVRWNHQEEADRRAHQGRLRHLHKLRRKRLTPVDPRIARKHMHSSMRQTW
jgi:predicted amidohydrolase YtcJ